MKSMFSNCQSLTSLSISHLNTENVIDMSYMFYNCTSLENLDVNFNTPNLQDIRFMLTDCNSLAELYVPKFNSKNSRKFTDVFNGCYNLKLYIDGSFFNIRSISPNYIDITDVTD